jgi:hypothetical protein
LQKLSIVSDAEDRQLSGQMASSNVSLSEAPMLEIPEKINALA